MFHRWKQKIHDYIRRHRAHCAGHTEFTKECRACRRANGNGIVLYWDDPAKHVGEKPVNLDICFHDSNGVDLHSSSDFAGFGGGDSGGGGSSGDW